MVPLEQAQPKDLDASEIDVRLGATWIDKDYMQTAPAPLPDGDRQRLAGRVHADDVPLRADGPFGEHIRP